MSGDDRLSQLTEEMHLISDLREHEQAGNLRQYLDNLPPGAFKSIEQSMHDYKDMSAVLGDLKLTDDGTLRFTTASGLKAGFDLHAMERLSNELERGIKNHDAAAFQQALATVDRWRKDGRHTRAEVDGAMEAITSVLKENGMLRGQLQGMQVLGLDARTNKLILSDTRGDRIAAIDGNTGNIFMGASITGIGGSLGGGFGDPRGRGYRFFRLNQEGEVAQEVTPGEQASVFGEDSVTFSEQLLAETSQGAGAGGELLAAEEGVEATSTALEASEALGASWEALLSLLAL